jgi:hypothetical protein
LPPALDDEASTDERVLDVAPAVLAGVVEAERETSIRLQAIPSGHKSAASTFNPKVAGSIPARPIEKSPQMANS